MHTRDPALILQPCQASKKRSSISKSVSSPQSPPKLPLTSHLQFTAKQLNRQAAKAGKDEQTEKAKLKKAIQQGHADIAKIYAQNAIRKQNEKLNLLRLGSRIDAVSSRVQTAVTMRQVTGSMANVVKGMDGAMKSMDLEKVSPFEMGGGAGLDADLRFVLDFGSDGSL